MALGVLCGSAQTPDPVAAAKPSPAQNTSPNQIVPDQMPNPGAADGVLVDQVIAVVNGDLILESDVEEERRFQAFQPFGDLGVPFSRGVGIERLVDRALILQQAKLQPDDQVTLDQAKAELVKVREEIPACKQYHCETEAGWAKFCHDQGFTVDEVTERWRQRMQLLKFVEERFRMGIRIAPQEIKDYYDQTLVPQAQRQRIAPPRLDAVSESIEEVLLQKRVTALLDDWLQSLKAQGSVRMMKPAEVTP